MSDAELREWAAEHLYYEASTLEAAARALKPRPKGPMESLFLQSFVVNARCLDGFLWGGRGRRFPDDMFAPDFCEGGKWEATRVDCPQAGLRAARDRWGREVMHLTRNRISGYGEQKQWNCGLVFSELATALMKFTELAGEETLDAKTRDYLRGLPGVVFSLGVVGGATGAALTAGTAIFDPKIVAGGN